MNIKIGAKIKMLRRRDDITQERLAEVLGVTNQAISRWESETGYPDIEYISPIANFFNVTTDYLFDHDIAEKRKKINEYCEIFDIHRRANKPPQERIDMMRIALAEFPAEEQLLFRLAKALYHKWCDYGWHGNWIDGYYIYDYKKYRSFDSWEESTKIMEELLATSLDDSIRSECREILAYIYGKIGEKDKVLAIAEKCDDISRSKENILAAILDGKDGITHTQEQLLLLLNSFRHSFLRIARFYIKESDVILEAYRIIINLFKFIFSDGNYGFYNFELYDIYLVYAYEYIKQNDFDEAFEALGNSYNHAKMFDIYLEKNETCNYTAPFVNLTENKLGYACAEKQLPALLRWLKDENSLFIKLRGDPRYAALVSRIEADIAGM